MVYLQTITQSFTFLRISSLIRVSKFSSFARGFVFRRGFHHFTSGFIFRQDFVISPGASSFARVSSLRKIGSSNNYTRNSTYEQNKRIYSRKNKSLLMYTTAVLIFGIGFTYASAPLYRMFCQTTGFSGTPMTGTSTLNPDRLVPAKNSRRIRVTFNADTSRALHWSFTPQQRDVRVLPGETALAFYTAKNESNKDIIGMATYNVTPSNVAPYFNKIQCFCFEEQMLGAGEQVDMPVFFFIDPEFENDPLMKDVDTITLSYTFFKAKYDDNGILIPIPA